MFNLLTTRVILVVLCIICCTGLSVVYGQITETQAKALLAEKNIPEDTLKVRLLRKGYDLDNLDPKQVANLQKVVEETIGEIEADRITNETQKKPAPLESTIVNTEE